MALNERVQRDINDLPFDQLAPSQAARESWYPGKRPQDIKPGDATWDRHYRSPVGVKRLEVLGPLEVERVRVEKLHRNTVCDQTLPVPVVTDTVTTTITDAATWGTVTPVSVVKETETPPQPAVLERTAGHDWAKGA